MKDLFSTLVTKRMEFGFRIIIKIGQVIFKRLGIIESFFIDCSKEGGSIFKAIKDRPLLTKLFCFYVRKICLNKRMSESDCFRAYEEHLILGKAVKTLDTTELTSAIVAHRSEYENLSLYIYSHTGYEVKFMYSPIILRSIRSGVCGVFNIHIDGCYIIIYDDIFRSLSEIDQKCFALHEVGHLYYKIFESFDEKISTHGSKGVSLHKQELEADDYAAYIVGKKQMRQALLHVIAKYNWISRFYFKREIIARMRELK